MVNMEGIFYTLFDSITFHKIQSTFKNTASVLLIFANDSILFSKTRRDKCI